MIDTPAPVTAWAVVDKDNAIVISAISAHKDVMEICAENFKTLFSDRAPHRVVKVTITPTGEG